MKRWVGVTSFLLFLALCASAVAWAMQLFKPVPRRIVAPAMPAASALVELGAAASLFGGRKASGQAANYVLRGVVVARKAGDSAAIIAVDGKPPRALPVGAEVVPGVTVKEIHPEFVLLSEGGGERRVPLPVRSSP